MIFQNIEFFNTAEIKEAPGGGYYFYRFPESAYSKMTDMGAKMSRQPTCSEIRFVTDAKTVQITLGARVCDITVMRYMGDYKLDPLKIAAGEIRTFTLDRFAGFDSIPEDVLENECRNRFSSKVWRFIFDTSAVFYSAEALDGTYLRAPEPEELPKTKMLIYGSSISHGCWADNSNFGYTAIAGEMLGWDVLNKGMSGSCRFEKDTADYIASEDFDIGYFELATNMQNPAGFDIETVISRLEYFFKTVSAAHKNAKLFAVPPFQIEVNPQEGIEHRQRLRREIDELIKRLNIPNLTYIDSGEIYSKPYYLCHDLVHPSDYGHINMAVNMVKKLKECL